MTKKTMILFFCMLFVTLVQAQTRKITGKVSSADEQEAIIGASVSVKGTSIGVATNLEGMFTLDVPTDAKTLVISYLGMETQEVAIAGQSVIDITLKTIASDLDEVLVIAYGTAKKSSFTGAANQIKADKFETRPLTSVTNALLGAAPGVQVSNTNGQPGSEPSIYIRGIGTISSSVSYTPLIVLNGMTYDNAISSINPNDIESITVLKDASSTALYGARAANGIILINTKMGNKDRMTVNVKVNQGITTQQTNDYKRLGIEDYLMVHWESTRNQLLAGKNRQDPAVVAAANASAAENLITGNLGYNPFNVPDNQVVDANGRLNPNAQFMWGDDTDWLDAVQQLGNRTDVSINISGGSNKSDYYLSAGYLTEKGYIIGSQFDRYTMNSNVSAQITPFLKIGGTLSGNLSKSIGEQDEGLNSNSNPFRFARYIGPIYPIHIHHPVTKDYVRDSNGNLIYDFGTGYTTSDDLNAPSRGYLGGNNPAIELQNIYSGYKRNTLNARAYSEIRFLDGFKLTLNGGVGANAYLSSSSSIVYPEKGNTGSASKTNTFTTTWTFNELLSYTKDINKHHFDILAGHESYDYEYNYLTSGTGTAAAKEQKIIDNNYELSNYSVPGLPDSYTNKYRIEGYLARINYDFANRYFLSASMRHDGSSRFYKDVRWNTFYSFGAGWRIEQEDFMKGLSFVDLLKLRVSYGEVGNDNIGTYYAWQASYVESTNGLEAGYVRDRVLNSQTLLWETSRSSDIALEFDLFKSRLSGSIEYFNRESSNLLFRVPQPPDIGLTTKLMNAGTMYNRGLEIALNVKPVQTKDFVWNLGINATYLKSKITHLPIEPYDDGVHRIEQGHSRYEFYLRKWAGVDPATGNTIYVPTEEVMTTILETVAAEPNPEKWPNTFALVDGQYYTTKVAEAEKDWAGNSTPPVSGGLTTGVSWKGISLNLLFNFQVGAKMYDSGYAELMTAPYGSALLGSTRHVDILQRWQNPGDRTNVPRIEDFSSTDMNAGTSTRWLVSSDMLELANVTLSYDLPKRIVNQYSVHGLRFYASADNALLFTKRQGIYPRRNIFSGTTGNVDVYLPSRIFTFGLNLSF